MSDIESQVSSSLRRLAETWLKRSLTPAEARELENFQQSWASGDAPAAMPATTQVQGNTTSSDPADHARAQAAQALAEGRQRSENVIRDILQKLQSTAAQALQAHEHEEAAILKIVESARSLNDLRPSALSLPGSGVPPAAQLVLPQIADRLANLVKSEVERCFQQNFGPLQRELANALTQLHDANKTPADTQPDGAQQASTQQASPQQGQATQQTSTPQSTATSNTAGNVAPNPNTAAQPAPPPAA
ncbi:hypothetical protein [Paraburkholderia kururiensis]|uniref:hypothetical protein n=1 Tax=Paraburkholderia kururiensis TaxID=984307 RepID=UPI00034674FA|nr:hypothetical protein [Paraburkholderia kururiensis]